MSFYLSDAETGDLTKIDGTVEEFRQVVQDLWVDVDGTDVVNNDKDWFNFCHGAGWSIHHMLRSKTPTEFLG